MDVQIVIGFFLDWYIGDPAWLPHPVRWVGKFISWQENVIRKIALSPNGLRTAGVVLVIVTVGVSFGVSYLLLELTRQISYVLYIVVGAVLAYYELAVRSMAGEAMNIHHALQDGYIRQAREYLSRIVGRDTDNLEQQEIIRGTVETVAENTSDGIIAPLFYLFIGGPALGMAYKAINTLDSMVGYRNEKYRDLGWASARLDDLANWIPARLTAYIMPVAAGLMGKDTKNGYRILRRDKKNHLSPNSGYPEAAMAGVLGIKLGGTNCYGGVAVEKPTIGDDVKKLEPQDIQDSVAIMKRTAIIALLIFMFVLLKISKW